MEKDRSPTARRPTLPRPHLLPTGAQCLGPPTPSPLDAAATGSPSLPFVRVARYLAGVASPPNCVVPVFLLDPHCPGPYTPREIPLLRSPCSPCPARGLHPLALAASRRAPRLSPELRAAVSPARLPPRARARHAATARCSHPSPSRRPPRFAPAAPHPRARTASRPRPLLLLYRRCCAALSVAALAASPHPAPAGAPCPCASPPPSPPPAAAPPRPPVPVCPTIGVLAASSRPAGECPLGCARTRRPCTRLPPMGH
nr:vegetative cell wall protein gp1-like [Aegilops tauschii subsp. strangulata]